ncbi:hypothetical protein MLD38_005204 [Melastoma candidum]|uniref:Uncharacterized protein n=1 Tax=Melastoma candidum TaxID=119954 RepID=A0ACB9SBE9_9MYRT|nr:hypothetical protein MLD38_005204 [Melastoma candidum]
MEEQIKTRPESTSSVMKDQVGKAKSREGIESAFHKDKHDKETHGTSDDIHKSVPVDSVKGPSVAQRMKEEIEAFVDAVIPGKDNN